MMLARPQGRREVGAPLSVGTPGSIMGLCLALGCILISAGVQAQQTAGRTVSAEAQLPAMWAHAARAPMNGLAHAGRSVVAVGRHGIVLISTDAGGSWTQARVPVASDLVAVSFPTPLNGWAVGHEGVVLASIDGGRSWVKKFDGRSIAETARMHYLALTQEFPNDKTLAAALSQSERLVQDGPDKPFLDIWFQDERRGFMVGAFGLIFATEDAGVSWQPWFERLDNPNALHLNSVRGEGDALYVVGEQGLVLKLDRASRRFVRLNVPFNGSFFGVAVQGPRTLVYGLSGHAFLSTDAGDAWAALKTGAETSFTGGTFLSDGRIALAGSDGSVLIGTRDGRTFKPSACAMACHSVVADSENRLVVAGSRGVRVLTTNEQ